MSDCTRCGSAVSRRTQSRVCKLCRIEQARSDQAVLIERQEHEAEVEHALDVLSSAKWGRGA